MKKHAMIPIFIPHIGCPCNCVFCDQNTITARTGAPSEEDVRAAIEERLPTLSGRDLDCVEIAFFGGSFTAIPREMQEGYLKIAKEYKDSGKIDEIRLSTRPDCIDEDELDLLEAYSVDSIELGAQSFSDDVLTLSKRGHTKEAIIDASRLIKSRGFRLGLQLMIGLPGDDRETATSSARQAAMLGPETARLYPTVVLPGTELADMLRNGSFTPMDEETMLSVTTDMYRILLEEGITILRVGLKSTDLVTGSADLSGDYHPAFRQLVEGRIAMEEMRRLLASEGIGGDKKDPEAIIFRSNEKWFPPMIGHKACNKKQLEEELGRGYVRFDKDNDLADGKISLETCFD